MSASKVSDNPTDLHEDEVLMTWLQCPIDDGFERNYCADLFSEWLPTAGEAAKVHPDVNLPAGSSLDMGINPCAGSGSSRLPGSKKVGSKSLVRPAASNAEDALALGAHRAAGLSSQVGQEAFNIVRTSMQPTTISQQSSPCSTLKPSIDRSRPVKLNLPVPSVPFACCKPIDGGVPSSPNSSRLYMCTALSTEKNKHALQSETFTFASKRSRKDYEIHSELSNTRQSGSSRITEDNTIKRGKMIGGDRKFQLTPLSYSEGSQTSMSLSFREAMYSGKRKLGDSELLSEVQSDADGESTDTRKPGKSSRRNRVAEVHNLSERNRRNRINDKLTALQALIPNSSKTDKASILDEAIEYTKILQMQLQMASMRNGMNVSPMMMPMALPQTHMHIAPLHSVGLGVPTGHAGMGTGFGVGMEMGYPVNLPQYSTASPFQAAPQAMSQYGVLYQSGSTASIQDCNQVFTHMGFLPSQSLPPSHPMQPMSPSTPHVKHGHQQGQAQDLRHPSLNHYWHEAYVNEQEGISDEKDWKRR